MAGNVSRRCRRSRRIRAWLAFCLVFLSCAGSAAAHWADLAMADITLDAGGVEMVLTVPTGLLGNVDEDHDGRLSQAEATSHETALRALLGEKIVFDVQGRTLPLRSWTVQEAPSSTAQGLPANSHSTLALRWDAGMPLTAFRVRYELFDAQATGSRCTVTVTQGGAFSTYAFTLARREMSWNDGKIETAPVAARSSLHELLDGGTASPKLVALALGVAFVLGALHGLSPGHGKTIVSAYLVGSRGTVAQAMLLGLVVTITHTSSVLLLGALCMTVFDRGVPPGLLPWLGAASGLLVSGMGVWMLCDAVRRLRAPRPKMTMRVIEVAKPLKTGLAPLSRQAHTHDHAHHPTHDHGHDHAHGAGLVHSHGGRSHSHALPERVTLWSLVTLAVSGGLVPCPDALAVLLAAIGMNRLAFGLLIIVAFSAGLAAVLMALGILAVVAGRMLDRFSPGRGTLDRVAVASYVIVTLLGLGIALQALVSGGVITLS